MTKARRAEPDEAAVDLSAAARAVVRDPGDPRIDAHLAALGLADDAPPAPARRAAEDRAAAEMTALQARIDVLEADLRAAHAQARTLAIGVAAAAIVIVVLLVLPAVR